MFGPVIDTAVALIFVYLILSLLCSAVQEWIAQLLGLRSSNLRERLADLLGDAQALQVLGHGVMNGLGSNGSLADWLAARLGRPDLRRPSHLPTDRFVSAFMATVGQAADDGQKLQAAIRAIPDPRLNQAATALLNDAKGEVDAFRARLAAWFDESMATASAIYRRKVQWWLLGIGLLVTVALNVDTLRVARVIFGNETLRAALVADAVDVAATAQPAAGGQPAISAQEMTDLLKTLPIGWTCPAPASGNVSSASADAVELCANFSPWTLLGWMITAVALSFGAPFWFDILGLAVNLRGDGSRKQQRAPAADA